jgi:hypothetical protein
VVFLRRCSDVSPAQIETSNIVHDIVVDIVYDIEYDSTDIVYVIDIRYRKPIYGGLWFGGALCVYCAIVLPQLRFEGISQVDSVHSEE